MALQGDLFFGFDLHERRTLEKMGLGVLAATDSSGDPVPTQTQLTAISNGTVLTGAVTYDPPSLIDAAGASTTVTVTGANLGDFAIPSFGLDLQGITVTAYVSAANTVTVRFQNETGGTIDLASGTLRARVFQA